MKKLLIVRNLLSSTLNGTFGKATIPETPFRRKTLERPRTGEHPCIPVSPVEGYCCALVKSPRLWDEGVDYGFGRGMVYEIQGVPGRDHILIHSANEYMQLLGCVSMGVEFCEVNVPGAPSLPGVTDSKASIAAFMQEMGGLPFMCVITESAGLV